MGTRGLYGFYKNGVTKSTYNHWDSYPDGLGEVVVNFIRETSIDGLNQIYDKIILVDEDYKPSVHQINECIDYYNNQVSTGEIYALLRESQGDLNAYKQGLRYMIDGKDFIKDSLFCEWAYIINLDNNKLEVYEGFQKEPNNNRYATTETNDGYYNCKLISEFDLVDIPMDWINQLNSEED